MVDQADSTTPSDDAYTLWLVSALHVMQRRADAQLVRLGIRRADGEPGEPVIDPAACAAWLAGAAPPGPESARDPDD